MYELRESFSDCAGTECGGSGGTGVVGNGDGKAVDPSLEGVRKPCRVTDMLTL